MLLWYQTWHLHHSCLSCTPWQYNNTSYLQKFDGLLTLNIPEKGLLTLKCWISWKLCSNLANIPKELWVPLKRTISRTVCVRPSWEVPASTPRHTNLNPLSKLRCSRGQKSLPESAAENDLLVLNSHSLILDQDFIKF